MKARLATVALGAALTLGVMALPAAAAPPAARADGSCVASGVKVLKDAIPGAAQGGLMSFVILDHAFNNAEGVEAALGVDPCADPT